jgi:cytidylate kinase
VGRPKSHGFFILKSMAKPNIILTGFMATGKTTVGKLLADQLGYDFVDTDELIGRISWVMISLTRMS